MPRELQISVGQHSDKGRKEINQDFHGAFVPREPHLSSKGVVVALADGISTSPVSQVASEAAVKSFIEDYFCTSEAWSVKKSAFQVLLATNSWLHAQTSQSPYRYDREKGYVCTLSAMVVKSTTAHLFHVGDTRIYRLHSNGLEQLTHDHRIRVSDEQSHLSRALGIGQQLEIDYQAQSLSKGDTFLLTSDGVHDFVGAQFIVNAVLVHENDLDEAARIIVAEAFRLGSTDNLTAQIVRVDELPEQGAAEGVKGEVVKALTELPLPPLLDARMNFDGYTVVREIHASSRSHVYLAIDAETKKQVALKIPSIEQRGDPAYLERFLLEDWIARRINSAYVLKPCEQTRKQNFLYTATEFVDGQTLTQWMIDNPRPELESVRRIAEQIAKGLMAFHRMEMLHQDLRPQNVMIDKTGTVKIIDFGSTRVAGLIEATSNDANAVLGTAQYTAPEYFLGEGGTPRSDLFSLGVIVYQMVSGKLPYGAEVAKSRTVAAQRTLAYDSVLDDDREIPAWIDEVLLKAVHVNPAKRYEELSEFIYDLRNPNQAYLARTRAPLIERNPVGFWKGIALILAVAVVMLLLRGHR